MFCPCPSEHDAINRIFPEEKVDGLAEMNNLFQFQLVGTQEKKGFCTENYKINNMNAHVKVSTCLIKLKFYFSC